MSDICSQEELDALLKVIDDEIEISSMNSLKEVIRILSTPKKFSADGLCYSPCDIQTIQTIVGDVIKTKNEIVYGDNKPFLNDFIDMFNICVGMKFSSVVTTDKSRLKTTIIPLINDKTNYELNIYYSEGLADMLLDTVFSTNGSDGHDAMGEFMLDLARTTIKQKSFILHKDKRYYISTYRNDSREFYLIMYIE